MLKFEEANALVGSDPKDDRGFKYLIVEDLNAGREGHYTVVKLSVRSAQVIGRELELDLAKQVARKNREKS